MKRPLAFVIEDQASLNILYEDALRLVGFDVIAVRDGLEALNKLEINEPPTFIILDINLPSLSGRDLLKHIRKHNRYDKTPVMILTANSVMATAIQPEITSNDHLFIKPISMKALQDFAKMMRPGKDGVAEHLAETQKIPSLPELDIDEDETAKNLATILTADDEITVDTQAKTESKLVTREHKAIIMPNNDIIDAQTIEKSKETEFQETPLAENSETKNKPDAEKAPADDAEAKTESKSEE